MTVRAAILGGSGVDVTALLDDLRPQTVETRYGAVALEVGRFEGEEVAFLRRHGKGHTVPPHRVNYRANIAALDTLGVRRILATAAVGSVRVEHAMGSFVVIDQFLDFTSGRESTFHDGSDAGVVHVDMTDPYCTDIRRTVVASGHNLGLPVVDGGTYVCAQGPRFESAAEIRMFITLGGDVVGMTGVPEVVLAREAGLCYATIAIVTNLAAGLRPETLSHEEVLEAQRSNAQRTRELVAGSLRALPDEKQCNCAPPPSPVGD
jgi:5'-methylthioadenosine phosphorylase